jgi:hypothetical protein
MPSEALRAAREQLAYWTRECETARRTRNAERIAQCERFIAQMELVVSALVTAAEH